MLVLSTLFFIFSVIFFSSPNIDIATLFDTWHAVLHFQSPRPHCKMTLCTVCEHFLLSSYYQKKKITRPFLLCIARHTTMCLLNVYCLPFADLFSFCSQQIKFHRMMEQKNALTKFVMNIIAECFMCLVLFSCMWASVCERKWEAKRFIRFASCSCCAIHFRRKKKF